MTRTQFWLLSAVSAVLIVLLFGHVYALRINNKLLTQLNSERASIANAQRLQPVLQTLVRRIDVAATNDLQLKSLLTKYGFKITREAAPTDGSQKPK
jgi:hypothetical protein